MKVYFSLNLTELDLYSIILISLHDSNIFIAVVLLKLLVLYLKKKPD